MSKNEKFRTSPRYWKRIAATLCVFAIAMSFFTGCSSNDDHYDPSGSAPSETLGSNSTPTTEPVKPIDPDQTIDPTISDDTEPTAPPATAPVIPPATEPVVPPATDPVIPPATEPTVPPVTEPGDNNTLVLPYAIPGTDLVIHNIGEYNGAYLEDASDAQVEGVAALVVENAGDTGVEYACITVNQGNEMLKFEVSALPAGAKAAVQEADRKLYVSGDMNACSAEVAQPGDFGLCEDYIQITENQDNSLTITNISDEMIPLVRVYYKYYMDDVGAYIGGIAYRVELSDLKPGQSAKVILSHYAGGYSRVVMVRIGDEQ